MRRGARLRATADAPLAVALAIGFCLIAFLASGGVALGPNTWTEIALVLVGAGLAIWLLVAGAPGPAWGRSAVTLFGCLAALTALSIAWSVEPDKTWIEAGRTLSYLAAFGGAAVLARLLPARWQAAAAAIALAATAISLWAVLVKVFTWQIGQQTEYGRLLSPFDYWNATGLTAALGLPPTLWAASRRSGPKALQSLAVPAVALLITVVVLSYSRSAIGAAALATSVPLAFGRTRLRSLLMLALGGAGAAVICAWALHRNAFTGDSPGFGGSVGLAARTASGHSFGLVVLVVLVALAVLGPVARIAADNAPLPEKRRRQIGIAIIGLVALVPVGAAISLLFSARGFTGQISHIWSTLTSTSGSVGSSPARVLDLANTRPAYWRQGWSVGVHHLLAGAGAGTFDVAHLAYPTRLLLYSVPNAHSYVVETFADFGLIGVVVNVALLLTWARSTGRTIGWRPGERSDERDGMLALLGVVVAFGISSAIDWTWFVPGVAVPALFAAGWLAGRGPLERTARAPAAGRRPLLSRPWAIARVTTITVAGLALVYAIWQPLRSANADGAAVSADQAGQLGVALTDARAAVADFPVSLDAIEKLASLYQAAGAIGEERAELVHATRVQSRNPASWDALGNYYLQHREYLSAIDALKREAALIYADAGVDTEIFDAAVTLQRLQHAKGSA